MINDELIQRLKYNIETILNEQKTQFDNKRIIITIDTEGIKVKLVTPLLKRSKQSKFDSKAIKKIEEAKKVLRGKRDLMYVVTLLISLEQELGKIKKSDLIENSKSILVASATGVRNELTSLIKEIE